MTRKRALFAALPLLVSSLGLWIVLKYQPKTVEVEGSSSQPALRALVQACHDYPLSQQITLRYTLSNSTILTDEFIYNRRKQRFSWTRPMVPNLEFSNIEDDDLRALKPLREFYPREHYMNEVAHLLLSRGCHLGNQ